MHVKNNEWSLLLGTFVLPIGCKNATIVQPTLRMDRKYRMATTTTPAAHLAHVYELLVATYGEPKNDPDYDPLGGLVGTILSQHTSDINSGRAYRQLIATLPTWEEVRDAPTHEVATAIKSGGLANIKAPRIQDALLTLTERQQEQRIARPIPLRRTGEPQLRRGLALPAQHSRCGTQNRSLRAYVRYGQACDAS